MSSFPVSQASSGTAIPATGSFQMSTCQHHGSHTDGHWQPVLPSLHKNQPTKDSCGVRELGKTAKDGKNQPLLTLRSRFSFAFKLKLLLLAQRTNNSRPFPEIICRASTTEINGNALTMKSFQSQNLL